MMAYLFFLYKTTIYTQNFEIEYVDSKNAKKMPEKRVEEIR